MENENASRRSGRLSQKPPLNYEEMISMKFDMAERKRKRFDAHTFSETQKPQKVQKTDIDHHPTQQLIPNTGYVPPSTIQLEIPRPPPEVTATTTIPQQEVIVPPPTRSSESENKSDSSLVVQLRQLPGFGGPVPVPTGNSQVAFVPPPRPQQQEQPKRRKKKRESDEEYQFQEQEENPEDYTLEVNADNFYYSNPKRERGAYKKKRPQGDGEYVMEDEESSESIGEQNEILEDGELEDIKRINKEMIEMEVLVAAEKGLPQPPVENANGPIATGNATTTTTGNPPQTTSTSVGDEDTGGDSFKKYNFRRRRVDPREERMEFGSVVRVSNKNRSASHGSPFDRYEKLERKRKKKNQKIKKMMRKARKNVPLRKTLIGDTTSSDDEAKDNRNISRFMRTGGANPPSQGGMPNAYTRITPLNRGVESRRLGFKPPQGDVDPVAIDKSITWDSIGGLKEHIIKLKEMVILPLLYPDVYTNLGIKPPRGVLFVGPPGTGKTLTARALCNMCRVTEQKEIAFFMRKGADILSKWVGEAEKQLRMLFDRAKELQPSIIFFDEVDGLAPVRSSKQDYIHTSIVSTLLALMDGLDDRGQVVVIGATNRADAVDPALRRPGRFDRELFFPLPDEKERKEILDIHTKAWKKPVPEDIKLSLAKRAVGFCGADLKSLCTETGLKALRRRYPQIYSTTDRLRINVKDVSVTREDWNSALKEMTPSYFKTREFYPQPLNVPLKALFQELCPNLENLIRQTFPIRKERHGGKSSFEVVGEGQEEEDPDQDAFWREMGVKRESKVGGSSDTSDLGKLMIYRPSVMIFGSSGNGQTNLLKALLHSPQLEYFRVFSLSLETLFDPQGGGGYTMEERLISQFKEIRSNSPCILAIPSLLDFWNNISVTTRNLFVQSIRNFPAHLPVLVIASVEIPKFDNNIQVVMQDEEDEDEDEIYQKERDENVLLEKERLEVRKMFLSMVPTPVLNLFRHQFQVLSPDKTSRLRFLKLVTQQVKSPILISNLPKDDENKEEEGENEQGGGGGDGTSGFEVDEERKKKLMKRLMKDENGYLDQLQDCLYRICNTLLSDRHFKTFHRPKIEKPDGGRGRGRPRKKKMDFIVDDDEELEYEEDILENNDPDAEFVPRKRVPPPPPAPLQDQLGVEQVPVNTSQVVIIPPPPLPEKVFLLDILENVNRGFYPTARDFLQSFEIFRDHADMYESFRSFAPSGYGRTGGYGGSVAEEEEEWKKRRVIESGKNLYKRVEISLQTIDRGLLKECKRISKRRKKRKDEEERKKKEAEERELRKIAKEEEDAKKQKELFPPLRRMTRGFLKKLDDPTLDEDGGRRKRKSNLKIKLPKMVNAQIPRGAVTQWEARMLEKTKGWNVERLEIVYSRWLREISKFKWQPKRAQLLLNLERILDEERVR